MAVTVGKRLTSPAPHEKMQFIDRSGAQPTMKQTGFPVQGFARRSTQRQLFLVELEAVVPWTHPCERIEPFYPKASKGRKSYPLPTMLRIHFLQHEINRRLSSLRAKLEHPFRGLKPQSGFLTLRYPGLAKNTSHLKTKFALANLYLARLRLLTS